MQYIQWYRGSSLVNPSGVSKGGAAEFSSAALDVLHHQHAERGSEDSGHYTVAQWNAVSRVNVIIVVHYLCIHNGFYIVFPKRVLLVFHQSVEGSNNDRRARGNTS